MRTLFILRGANIKLDTFCKEHCLMDSTFKCSFYYISGSLIWNNNKLNLSNCDISFFFTSEHRTSILNHVQYIASYICIRTLNRSYWKIYSSKLYMTIIYEGKDQSGYVCIVGLSKKWLLPAKNGKSVNETGASRMFQRLFIVFVLYN